MELKNKFISLRDRFLQLDKKKKIAGIAALAAVVFLLAALLLFHSPGGSDAEDAVYVQKVSDLTANSILAERYSGVVESQRSVDFKKDPERTIETVFVSAGQEVEKDTPLFQYDVKEAQNSIASIKLEIEGLNNEISVLKADAGDTQTKLQISQKELEINQKKAEMDKCQKQIDQSVVKSTLAGVVKTVNEAPGTDNTGSEQPVVSITETGQFRIKGKVSEQSIASLSSGQPVIVRSRINEDQTWTGSISTIETEPVSQDPNQQMMDEGSGERASSYPFYVSLEDTEGLMLGQHVYIEPDYGQTEIREGIWLDEGFLLEEEDGTFVWGEKRGKLKKIRVETGDLDEEGFIVQITSGLSEEDYITWPDDTLKEGMKVQIPREDE